MEIKNIVTFIVLSFFTINFCFGMNPSSPPRSNDEVLLEIPDDIGANEIAVESYIGDSSSQRVDSAMHVIKNVDELLIYLASNHRGLIGDLLELKSFFNKFPGISEEIKNNPICLLSVNNKSDEKIRLNQHRAPVYSESGINLNFADLNSLVSNLSGKSERNFESVRQNKGKMSMGTMLLAIAAYGAYALVKEHNDDSKVTPDGSLGNSDDSIFSGNSSASVFIATVVSGLFGIGSWVKTLFAVNQGKQEVANSMDKFNSLLGLLSSASDSISKREIKTFIADVDSEQAKRLDTRVAPGSLKVAFDVIEEE